MAVDESVEELKHYLQSLKFVDVNEVRGNTHNERLDRQEWFYQTYANDFVKSGINKEKLLKVGINDEGVTKLVVRYFQGQASFIDYLSLAEIAVIARVGDAFPNSPMTYAGPGFFKLNVSGNLLATPDIENIAVVNSLNPHHRKLYTGRECVFFLSPTYTEHFISPKKEYPNLPEYLRKNLPDNFLTSRFPTYCSSDGEIFNRENHIGGPDDITRSEMLSLAKTNS